MKLQALCIVKSGKIQSNSDPAEWKHTNGDLNVADDVSRGVAVSELNG